MSLTKLNFFSSTHRHVMDVGVSYVTHLFKTVYFFLCFFLFSSLEFYVKTTKLITLDFCTGISKKIMSFFSLETSQLSFRGVLSCPIYDQEKLLHFLIFSRLIPYSFDWLYFACSAPRLQFGNSFGGRLARKFIECACYSSTFLSLTANFFQKSIFTQISVFSSFEFNAANRG